MFIVEVFQGNEMVKLSWHINRQNADIAFDVAEKAGKRCRILSEGLIIKTGGNRNEKE
jgi:hypothetical protein